MSKYYYHGILSSNIESACTQLLDIIDSNGIKSKRLLGYRAAVGYNGLDYVSICQKKSDKEYIEYVQEGYSSAYSLYIHNHFCLIISGDIEAITPSLVSLTDYQSVREYIRNCFHDLENRVSDMFDEYQVKGEIPLSKVIGIGIPVSKCKIHTIKETSIPFQKLVELARLYHWDIVDTSDFHFVDRYESKKEENSDKVYRITYQEGDKIE